ncbi:MAG: hypothetical protein RXO27_02055 [Acidilobus sp.]
MPTLALKYMTMPGCLGGICMAFPLIVMPVRSYEFNREIRRPLKTHAVMVSPEGLLEAST